MGTNKYHNTANISPNAIIGKGNTFMEGVIVRDNVTIGDNNIFYPNSYVGLMGEVKGETEPTGRVVIGSGNTIRERVSIHSPVRTELTFIADNCYIMNGCHIAHDCFLAEGAVLAPYVTLGGMVNLGFKANVGMKATINPRLSIGDICMIGSGSVVTKDVSNYQKWAGVPARQMGYNKIGMQRAGLSPQQIDIICE